jgi:hypothetical protein
MEKGERIVDLCHNVRYTQSSVHKISDNADRIRESTKSGTKVFVCVARLPHCSQKEPDIQKYRYESLKFLLH